MLTHNPLITIDYSRFQSVLLADQITVIQQYRECNVCLNIEICTIDITIRDTDRCCDLTLSGFILYYLQCQTMPILGENLSI